MRNKEKKLVIVGLGETAELAYGYFSFDSLYEPVAFSAERPFIDSSTFKGLPVIPLDQLPQAFDPAEVEVFVAVSSTKLNTLRTRLYRMSKGMGYTMASYISSKAYVGFETSIGDNCFILENNTIQPFVRIGNNVTCWSGNHIGHRTVIHDNCFLSSQVVLSGFCEIGENCFLGVNSCVAENVKIGDHCLIGLGAVIHKNVKAGSIYKTEYAKRQVISAKDFYGIE